VKSHYPERAGWRSFEAKRVVLLVRFPHDAICSYFQMAMTNTHDEALEEEVWEKYEEKFEGLAASEAGVWREFHQWWKSREGVQILLVRYEDLLGSTHQVMLRVVRFCLGEDAWAEDQRGNRLWDHRIQHALRGHDNAKLLGGYKPRVGGGGVGKNCSRFSARLLAKMELQLGDSLDLFGYHDYKRLFHSNANQNDKSQTHVSQVFQPLDGHAMLWNETCVEGSIRVNQNRGLRPLDDPYGRNMTAWRRSQTDDDKNPFPTLKRVYSDKNS